MCNLTGNKQINIKEMLAVLPDPEAYLQAYSLSKCYLNLEPAVEKAMPKLRELTDNCPACIMAALRQKGIPVPCAESFNFKKEAELIFYDCNKNNFYESPLI
jgi:hypothetical protein